MKEEVERHKELLANAKAPLELEISQLKSDNDRIKDEMRQAHERWLAMTAENTKLNELSTTMNTSVSLLSQQVELLQARDAPQVDEEMAQLLQRAESAEAHVRKLEAEQDNQVALA